MNKKSALYLAVAAVFSVFLFSLFLAPDPANAVTCILKSATWDKTRAGDGESVGFTIQGENCSGWDVAVKIWEADVSSNDFVTGATLRFSSDSRVRSFWTVNQSKGGDVAGESEFFIEAVAGAGAGSTVKSGYLYVRAGGAGTGGAEITNFDVNPKQIPENTTEALNYTFKFKIPRVDEFKEFCGTARPVAVVQLDGKKIRDIPFNLVAGQQNYSLDFTENYQAGSSRTVQAKGLVSCVGYTFYSQPVSITIGAGGGGGTCNNNGNCDSGETSATCPADCKIKPGESKTFLFKLENPLQAENFVELIDVIATWLFNLAIPVAVAMIVYAGVMFLTSRGDTGKVTKAKQILLYAVAGLAIILIGKGFITLIESILNLGASP